MFKKAIAFSVLMLLFVPFQWVGAGSSQELAPDVPVQGELTERGEQDLYTYTAQGGENVIITVAASADSGLDTVLELYNPEGDLVEENDDSEFATGTTDSEIRATLTAAGEYRIIVKAFGGLTTGAYEILLRLSDEPTVEGNQLGDETPIELGAAVRGSLAAGEFDVWTFTPNEDMTVQIALFSIAFDTRLEVYDSDGALIATDDDSGGGYNAALSALNVTAGETYEIRALGYSDTESGDYVLTIAQTAPPPLPVAIEYGQTLDSVILPGLETEFFFSGTANDVISAEVTSSFDTYLTLKDEEGNVLAEDDDSGGELQAALLNYVLPETGRYSLVVTGYSSFEQGEFSLSLRRTELVIPDNAPLEYEQTVEGFLTPEQRASYRFSGVAGDLVNIFVSADFDTLATLYDSSGRVLVENDDSGGGLNPFIRVFRLPADGEYQIVVSGFAADARGAFSLSLNRVTVAAEKAVSYGDSADAVLEGNEVALFTFRGEAGDSVSISVSSAFDTFLQLRNSDGTVLIEDDDSGGELQPAIADFSLPASGSYTILVMGYSGADSGSLTLSLSGEGITTTTTTAPIGGQISYGESVEASLSAGETAEYSFSGNAGDVVSIAAQADFDGYLELRDAADALVANDDDSGDGLNPLLQNITLPADGDYTIHFGSFDNQGRGAFTLTLTEEASTSVETPELAVIAFGDRITDSMAAGEIKAYTFEAQAGDQVSIGVFPAQLSSAFDLYLEVYQPDGALLTADDDGGWRLNPALVGAVMPVSGTYKVTVQSFAGTDSGDFLLALERGAVLFSPSGDIAQSLPFDGETAALGIELGAGKAVTYTFTAVAGQSLTINMATGTVGADLYGGEGAIEESLPLNTPFELPADGLYGLVLYSESGGGDALQVTLTSGAAPTAEPPPLVITAKGEVAVDVPVRGTLQPNEVHTWTFFPLLDGEYSFLLNSEDASKRYDPALVILDAAGTVLGQDDDSGGEFNALVQNISLLSGQPVTIEVHSFADQSGGDYLLAVISETVVEPSIVQGGELQLGVAASGALEIPGQQAEFSFTVAAGGVFDFSLDGLKLPYIDLYDAENRLIGRGAAAVKGQALEEGTYRVVIYDRLNRSGEFTLIVEEAGE